MEKETKTKNLNLISPKNSQKGPKRKGDSSEEEGDSSEEETKPKKEDGLFIKRPIIFICNDPYSKGL